MVPVVERQRIKSAGQIGDALAVDVTDEEALRTVVDDIVRTHGRLDIVHANAGVLIAGTAWSSTAGSAPAEAAT